MEEMATVDRGAGLNRLWLSYIGEISKEIGSPVGEKDS